MPRRHGSNIKVVTDPIFTKLFWANNFGGLNLVGPKNYLHLIFFRPRFWWTKICSDPQFYWTSDFFWNRFFFWANIFLYSKFIFWFKKFFGSKLFWPKSFWVKNLLHIIFFNPIPFWNQYLFGPKTFLGPQNLFRLQMFFNSIQPKQLKKECMGWWLVGAGVGCLGVVWWNANKANLAMHGCGLGLNLALSDQ